VARRVSQLVFAGYLIGMSVLHQLGEKTGSVTPSIDALCPFGAVETLWTWVTTGRFISMIHPSNLVLGLAVLVGYLAGNAFCGWVCPFGAYQDGLTWIRRKLHIPEVKFSARTDAILRYGRFVVLAIIIFASISTLKLWFAEYDPYRTLFGLHWLFAFNLASMWPAFVILGAVTIGSLLIDRFWCRYLCPAGAVLSVLSHFSLLRIRRKEAAARMRSVRGALPGGDQSRHGRSCCQCQLRGLPGLRGGLPARWGADCALKPTWTDWIGEGLMTVNKYLMPIIVVVVLVGTVDRQRHGRLDLQRKAGLPGGDMTAEDIRVG
jgi:polyferredoxin